MYGTVTFIIYESVFFFFLYNITLKETQYFLETHFTRWVLQAQT